MKKEKNRGEKEGKNLQGESNIVFRMYQCAKLDLVWWSLTFLTSVGAAYSHTVLVTPRAGFAANRL